MAPWGHDRWAIGVIAHKGWEHRPEERMCQQIFLGLSTTTSQPGGPYNEGGCLVPHFHIEMGHLLHSGRLGQRLLAECTVRHMARSNDPIWMMTPPPPPSSLPLFLSPGADQALLQRPSRTRSPAETALRITITVWITFNAHVIFLKSWTWYIYNRIFFNNLNGEFAFCGMQSGLQPGCTSPLINKIPVKTHELFPY